MRPEDLDRCSAIERACYGVEGATRERIERRIRDYPQKFLVAQQEGEVVGFVNSGSTSKEDISDEAFKDLADHDPAGANIVIFSLAVHPRCRGRGYSEKFMHRCIDHARGLGKKILLLCNFDHLEYYRRYRFEHQGRSRSAHGGMQWEEMQLAL